MPLVRKSRTLAAVHNTTAHVSPIPTRHAATFWAVPWSRTRTPLSRVPRCGNRLLGPSAERPVLWEGTSRSSKGKTPAYSSSTRGKRPRITDGRIESQQRHSTPGGLFPRPCRRLSNIGVLRCWRRTHAPRSGMLVAGQADAVGRIFCMTSEDLGSSTLSMNGIDRLDECVNGTISAQRGRDAPWPSRCQDCSRVSCLGAGDARRPYGGGSMSVTSSSGTQTFLAFIVAVFTLHSSSTTAQRSRQGFRATNHCQRYCQRHHSRDSHGNFPNVQRIEVR